MFGQIDLSSNSSSSRYFSFIYMCNYITSRLLTLHPVSWFQKMEEKLFKGDFCLFPTLGALLVTMRHQRLTAKPHFQFQSAQRYSVTAVSLNRYNNVNATQGNLHKAYTLHNKQTHTTIIIWQSLPMSRDVLVYTRSMYSYHLCIFPGTKCFSHSIKKAPLVDYTQIVCILKYWAFWRIF